MRGRKGKEVGEEKKEEEQKWKRGRKGEKGQEGRRKGGERGRKKRGGRMGGMEERKREERGGEDTRTLHNRVSYCQCNFEDCLLVQFMCQHVCLLHESVGVQHSVDETLTILVLPLFFETVSVGVFMRECVMMEERITRQHHSSDLRGSHWCFLHRRSGRSTATGDIKFLLQFR